MKSKTEFASKIGLIAATVGSAVGLGNIWRFPAEAQADGGSAFLLLYTLCVIVLGIPVMLAEFSLGRSTKSDAIGAFMRLAPGTGWPLVGVGAVCGSYLILCFYMVVAGWTLEYLFESITGGLYAGIDNVSAGQMKQMLDARMDLYIGSDLRPLVFTWLLIGINIWVLLGGVRKGIERLANVMMPLLFVILAVMCVVSLSLPDASEGVRFFMKPDFSKITTTVVVNALGQAFFSLSLGVGILITYAAYYPPSTNMGRTSFIVALMSLLVAVMVGLIIFPAIKSFGLDNEPLQGATLVFVTLPEIFARMPLPQLWSTLFFVLLLCAALTSTVSIAEVSIAMLEDRLGMSRRRATLTVLLPLLLVSSLCSLSFGSLSELKFLGLTIFELLDKFTTDYVLLLVSLFVCIFVGWFAPRRLLSDELSNHGTLHSSFTLIARFIIRYIAPVLILVIFIYNFI